MSDNGYRGNLSSTNPHTFVVVGIGASAGGLHALEKFFEHLSANSNAAYVVIQHLSPDFKSLMKELLERCTRMAIHRVEEGMELQPNSIYLIPPGKNLLLDGKKFHLTAQKLRNSGELNFPIDVFFESLAHTMQEYSMGIVLSGTGSDGSKGLAEINRVGGLTLVQEPTSAQFDGMPRSAIATGIIDHILSPSELARETYQLVRSTVFSTTAPDPSITIGSESLQQIAEILKDSGSVDFSNYKASTLARRIHRRYLISGCTSLDEFIQLLNTSAEERSNLRHDLLISVTRFFRDRLAWEYLSREVIPQLIAKTPANSELRCWVTACATGEEAYSLAMLFDEAIARSDKPLQFKIFATDIDEIALEKAAQGIYSQAIVEELAPERLERYFVTKDNSWQVARELRKKILFAPHDLTKDAGFTRMDLVSCRNILIYFQPQLQQRVLRNLHYSLVSPGILFLGEAETLGYIEPEFKTLHKKSKIFQKKRDVRLNIPFRGIGMPTQFSTDTPVKASNTAHFEPMLARAFSSFLAKYQATCFLVDRQHRLFHNFNDDIEVLKMPQGKMTTDITKLILKDLQLPLITALHRAKTEQSPTSYSGIRVQQSERLRYLKLEVNYYESSKLADDYFVIVVQEDSLPSQVVGEKFEVDATASQRIIELDYELQQTRENLQAVIEELEATNEEQQATNEELTASNEELQSTNEELHSVNEELFTVNAEYQSKIEELTELNNDVYNLLRSTDIGVVFLDLHLRIRKFTPAATVAINLVEADINRPLEHITHNLDCQGLMPLLQSVIADKGVVDREVRLVKQDFHLLMRIHPYLLENGCLDGLVISFIDIDELKTIQQQIHLVNQDLQHSQLQLRQLNQQLEKRVEERTQALQSSEARLRAILETTTSIIYIKDLEGKYLLANRQYLKSLDLKETEILGKSDRDLFSEVIAESIVTHDREVIASQSVLRFEEQLSIGDRDLRTYISIKAPLIDDRGRVYAVCGISTDISEQKSTEVELRESAARERTILEIVAKIRETFELRDIFENATHKLRETLNCDRLVLYRFNADWSGKFVSESVATGWTRLLGSDIETGWNDTCLQKTKGGNYSRFDYSFIINDVAKANFSDCHRRMYHKIEAKSFCIVPVFQGDVLWGLLAAYQNRHPRVWKEGEIRLLTQTGIQLGISLAQVDLFTQIQHQSQQLQQAKEAAEAANHAKSAFIAHTSHELRTPLNAILGFAQILQREPDLESNQRGLEVIRQSGQHLLTLINDILYIAKIEAGKLKLELRDFIFPAFLDNLAAIIRVRCQQKAIAFEYQTLSSLPIIVKGDETRLRQLLLNLLSNAVKFTNEGKVTFQVGYTSDFPATTIGSSNHNQIRFYVRDTGCGIPQDKLQDIFLPFHQLDPHQLSQEGTGLGLTIGHSLAEQMGGEIKINSEIGSGSIFWFDLTLPITNASTAEITIAKDKEIDVVGYQGSTKKILVVDDLDDNREILVSFLTSLGFEMIEAKSGSEAIALTHSHQPDLILLDSIMPEVNGSQVIQNLRQSAQFSHLPIAIVSASTQAKDKLYSYEAGASDFLEKPLNFEQLLQTLERHLKLVWLDRHGHQRSLLNKQLSATEATAQPPLVIPDLAVLTQLEQLVAQGDIRGTISYASSFTDNPELNPFMQQVTLLAETCQLRKLKLLMQQYLNEVNDSNSK